MLQCMLIIVVIHASLLYVCYGQVRKISYIKDQILQKNTLTNFEMNLRIEQVVSGQT